ncbi:zinc finger, CCHC-type containing protein [Tanacetum coccineum]
MEMFKNVDFMEVGTDRIPPFIIGGNEDDNEKTHYSDNLNLEPEYKYDESVLCSIFYRKQLIRLGVGKFMKTNEKFSQYVETASENSVTPSEVSSDRVRIFLDGHLDLEEIHVTWAQLDKKHTNYLEEKHIVREDGITNYNTLGDYSKPSHEGYRNTIELPKRNNVVPLRSNTIRLVQNGCSFYGLRSEYPNQHLKDFLKLMDSLDLDVANREKTRSISTWEDLTTRFLAEFFLPGRTTKLRNDILMFQQHQGESLSEVWTRFKDLLQKVPHHGIDRWLQIQFFYDHVSFHLKCEIDHAAGGKLHDKNADESWEIIKNLALYDHEGWNDSKDHVNPVKAVAISPKEEENGENNGQVNNSVMEPGNSGDDEPPEGINMKNKAERKTDDEPANSAKENFTKNKENESAGASDSRAVRYYLNHKINEKLIEGLVENHRFNDSLSAARVGKMKRKTYNLLPRGPVYEAILKENITKKEDIGGNFEIPCNIGAKDMIKFDKGTITLRFGKSKISFHRILEPNCKIKKGIKNDIEPIAPMMTINRLVLDWEEKIKLHQEKEMKFDQWRSKIFNNEHPASIKEECEVENKGEVM